MKKISIWASKNQKTAIGFIVVIELLKIITGFTIGNNALPVFSTNAVELSVLIIVFLVSFVQINYENKASFLSKIAQHKLRLKSTAIIFFSTLLLAILSGNYFKNLGYSIDNQMFSYAGVTIKTDSTQRVETSHLLEKNVQSKQFIQKNRHFFSKKTAEDEPTDTGKRIGFVLLFMLSLVLTVAGVYLSCGIACSGFGFLALLALLLTLGIFSGGIYFLIKSFRKTIVPWREMTPEEKKKERKKFFSTWGIIVAIGAVFALVSALGV